MTGQLRYLASKAYQSLSETTDSSSSLSGNTPRLESAAAATTATTTLGRDFCIDCMKYGVLCHNLKISSISPPTSEEPTSTATNKNDETSSAGIGDIIIDLHSNSNASGDQNLADQLEQQASLVQELRAMIRVLHSSYVSSRVELKVAIEEGSIHERRAISQQENIDDLQSKLNKLSHELTMASGSAGEFATCKDYEDGSDCCRRLDEEAAK
jgi:hypothetical protein